MIVALGAVDGEAHERLAHVFRHRFRILMDGVKICGAIFQCVPLGGDDLSDELIPRGDFFDLAAKPIVVGFEGQGAKLFATDEEQVGQTIGPVVDEFRLR